MRKWFVINTKPKKETQVERIFAEAGFEIYCPKYAPKKSAARPFFPGYVFLNFDHPAEFRLVKYTRGVKSIVGNDAGPIPIPDETVPGIRSREVDGLIVLGKYGRVPEQGDDIEVVEGPLKGLRGVFQKELADRDRVMILLNYISYQGVLLIEKEKLKKV